MSKTKTKCVLRIYVCRNVHMYLYVYCLCTWELCVVSFKKSIIHQGEIVRIPMMSSHYYSYLFVNVHTYIYMYFVFFPFFETTDSHSSVWTSHIFKRRIYHHIILYFEVHESTKYSNHTLFVRPSDCVYVKA